MASKPGGPRRPLSLGSAEKKPRAQSIGLGSVKLGDKSKVVSALVSAGLSDNVLKTKSALESSGLRSSLPNVRSALEDHSPLAAIAPSAAPEPVPKADESEYAEYLIERDGERPFSFAGVVLGRASVSSMGMGLDSTTATIYRTRGGKFIAELQRSSPLGGVMDMRLSDALAEYHEDDDTPRQKARSSGYHRAAVFETLEAALGWFKPGRLTDKLRDALGLNKPIRID